MLTSYQRRRSSGVHVGRWQPSYSAAPAAKTGGKRGGGTPDYLTSSRPLAHKASSQTGACQQPRRTPSCRVSNWPFIGFLRLLLLWHHPSTSAALLGSSTSPIDIVKLSPLHWQFSTWSSSTLVLFVAVPRGAATVNSPGGAPNRSDRSSRDHLFYFIFLSSAAHAPHRTALHCTTGTFFSYTETRRTKNHHTPPLPISSGNLCERFTTAYARLLALLLLQLYSFRPQPIRRRL